MNIMKPGIFRTTIFWLTKFFSKTIPVKYFNVKIDIDNQFVDEKSFLVPKYYKYEDEQGRR